MIKEGKREVVLMILKTKILSTKAQLAGIEFKFFIVGFLIALILAFILVGLSCHDVVLPRLSFLCGG